MLSQLISNKSSLNYSKKSSFKKIETMKSNIDYNTKKDEGPLLPPISMNNITNTSQNPQNQNNLLKEMEILY